jgi:hypothetical protein
MVYFTASCYIIFPFGIHTYFVVIWYNNPVLVCYSKKIWQPWAAAAACEKQRKNPSSKFGRPTNEMHFVVVNH